MTKVGWYVHVLTPVAPLYRSLPPVMLLSASIFLLLALGLLFSLERRRNLRRMRQAQSQLEHRVKERTRELEDANTQLKQTQDELIQAAKLTVIGSLSASINHEINQPLAALRSYAQNTQTFLGRGMHDKAQENLVTIISLTDRLAEIVAQFKSFTRKSQGQDKPTSINETVQEALTIVHPEIDKQGVRLELQLPGKPWCFYGDKIRLQQVLVNLISNAIVAMQRVDERLLTISINVEEMLCIRIQDSGPGVNESQMEKIFEPYFTTSQRQGLGLGLSISRRIVESMQAPSASPTPPKVALYFRSCCLCTAARKPNERTRIHSPDPGRRTPYSTVLSQLFELEGISAKASIQAKEILRHLSRDWMGVVITDVNMPGMDGISVMQQIKQLDADLPVILITGFGDIAWRSAPLNRAPMIFWKNPSTTNIFWTSSSEHWTSAA